MIISPYCASEEQNLYPRASHARPRTAGSTAVIRRHAEWRSSCFPPNAHIYETTTGVVCNFVRLRSTFPNRTAWELTALLTPTAHPGIPGLKARPVTRVRLSILGSNSGPPSGLALAWRWSPSTPIRQSAKGHEFLFDSPMLPFVQCEAS
jgi:hypothetical protein